MINIGVLSLQGSVEEHLRMLSLLDNVNGCEVKTRGQLDKVSGLIIPGGESTTIGKLLKEYKLLEPLVDKAENGFPIWGTCAGMILLAKEIIDHNYSHISVMDIAVRRNAYGSQLDSFSTNLSIPSISDHDIPLVFIRAPWIERVWGNAKVIAKAADKIIAARQENILVTSFHPELTSDISFHKYFLDIVKNQVNAD